MAKQKGIFKVEGTLGDVTFYKSKDGYMIREKGGISAERMASDPAFERTRENQAEFGRAGKAGKLLRTAFRPLLQNAADSRMVSRMLKEMMRVVKADATSQRGQRNVLDGELELLENFEFNDAGKLGQTFFAPFTATINRTTGALAISIPAFVPLEQIAAPAEATHFRILAGGGSIDFESGQYSTDTESSAMLPLGSTPTTALSLQFTVAANSTHPLMLVLGISFFQAVNGSHYSLKNGAYNALALVRVSGV
jgi:hypothetical protein